MRGHPRSGSPRALGIPDLSPGQEMLSARPHPSASLFPRPENRSASYGWPGQARRRRASEAVTASALRLICPPHPWDSCTESPALNARLSPRAWGARAPGPERAVRSLGRSRYALALLGQGRSAPSASLNGRRKRASAAAPALISPSAFGRYSRPVPLAFRQAAPLP